LGSLDGTPWADAKPEYPNGIDLPVLSRVDARPLTISIDMPFGGQQSGKFVFQIGHRWIETHATCSLFKELPVLSLWHGNCL
jgi:hypothetical protein